MIETRWPAEPVSSYAEGVRLQLSLVGMVAALVGCNAPPAGARDGLLADRAADVVRDAPDELAIDARRDRPAELGPPACPTPPCAAYPIIFVHGFRGSNDDALAILEGLVATDSRYGGYQLAGRDDHVWGARSIERRRWLFAFDYYNATRDDTQGAYTAGPGRIGSNTAKSCAAPPGNGYLLADDSSYDAGVSHDYAADLAAMVESVLLATGAGQVDVVAHSMGGMILRSYLSFYGGATRVRRALLLSSPVKGAPLVGFLAYFPIGQPSWMNAHEVAEIDGGSVLSKIHFRRCGDSGAAGAWCVKLLEQELGAPPATELHVASGQLDPTISYGMTDHPLALSHVVIAGADHSGILKKPQTMERVAVLLGGLY